ncbi:hypothetical protein B0H14DRAFT_3425151 [Mycena olivaceomarginata]|nr:hypothetical protein B0H14DRAFT_3495533 [Mycena olivaceomarginata]KAJ7897102.1 hypothetical protein B0H14DRAFT_3425151 [Mycena olivaceomarginata]
MLAYNDASLLKLGLTQNLVDREVLQAIRARQLAAGTADPGEFMCECLRKKYSAYLQDVLSRACRRYGPLGVERVHAVHVGADSRQIRTRDKTTCILNVIERLHMHSGSPAVKRAHAVHVGADSRQIRTRDKTTRILNVLERLYMHFRPPAVKRAHVAHDVLERVYVHFGPSTAKRAHAVHVGADCRQIRVLGRVPPNVCTPSMSGPTLQLSARSIPDTKLLVVRMSLSGLTGLLVRPLPTACMAKTSGTDYRPHHPDPFHL